MPEYEVKEGDWFPKIVRKQGYGNVWKSIFNSSDNADFRQDCPDPNLLISGKKCKLPDKNEGTAVKATDNKWKFELKPGKAELNLVIIRAEGKPLKNSSYTLVLHGLKDEEIKGKTDANGRIKHPITTEVERATLNIEGQSIELLVGHLEPVTTTKGVQARLQNLNYHVESIDGDAGAGTSTEDSIKAFQKNHSISETEGEAGPLTQAKLKSVYGC